jgi:hypothetical protein
MDPPTELKRQTAAEMRERSRDVVAGDQSDRSVIDDKVMGHNPNDDEGVTTANSNKKTKSLKRRQRRRRSSIVSALAEEGDKEHLLHHHHQQQQHQAPLVLVSKDNNNTIITTAAADHQLEHSNDDDDDNKANDDELVFELLYKTTKARLTDLESEHEGLLGTHKDLQHIMSSLSHTNTQLKLRIDELLLKDDETTTTTRLLENNNTSRYSKSRQQQQQQQQQDDTDDDDDDDDAINAAALNYSNTSVRSTMRIGSVPILGSSSTMRRQSFAIGSSSTMMTTTTNDEFQLWRTKLQDMEDERDELRSKLISKGEAIVVMVKRESVMVKEEEIKSSAIQQLMAAQMEAMEDEQERMAAKWYSQQHKMEMLEQENKQLKSTSTSNSQQQYQQHLHFRGTLQTLEQKVERLEGELNTSNTKCQTQHDTLLKVKQEKQLAMATADEAKGDLQRSMAVMQAQMGELQFERDELLSIHNADSGMFDAYGLLEGDSNSNDSLFGYVNND